jgi:hypothetical protein
MSVKSKKLLEKIVIPYSQFFELHDEPDIYTGNENIPFEERHSTYKALLKVEFEDAIKYFQKYREKKV